jgi:hypothetical protein
MRWTCRAVAATVVLLAATANVGGQAPQRRPLQEGDRPSIPGMFAGSLLGGLVFSGAAGATGLVLGGGNTDCYEGGCAGLLMAAAAWPLGTAVGARLVAQRQGHQVGLGRVVLYSILGAATGVAGGLYVKHLEPDRDSCRPSATTPSCGTGPSDWAYGFATVGAHLLTLVVLTHFTVQFHEGTAVSFAPIVTSEGVSASIAVRAGHFALIRGWASRARGPANRGLELPLR